MAVLIPETYVEDLTVRLSLYRRLSDIDTETERETFAAELIDRFGPLPEETVQLMDVTAIKTMCKTAGISKLDAGPKGAVFTFRDDTNINPADIMMLVRSRPAQLKLRPDSKLVLSGSWGTPERRLEACRSLLIELAGFVKAGASET